MARMLVSCLILLPAAFQPLIAATPNLPPSASELSERDSVPAGYVAAPYYPTPKGGWVASWANSYAKAQAVVKNMTLAEKVNLTTGTGYFMVSAYVRPLQRSNQIVLTSPRAHALGTPAAPSVSVYLVCVYRMQHWE